MKNRRTTAGGIAVAAGIVTALIDQISLIADNDPSTGDWRIILALAFALGGVVYWAVNTRDA